MTAKNLSRFDDMCANIPDYDARMATIYVADGCYMAKLWFEQYGVTYTAADLLRWAEMVEALKEREGIND